MEKENISEDEEIFKGTKAAAYWSTYFCWYDLVF